MKNLKFLFLLAFALLLAKPAFALQCKDGTYLASDECWTEVKVSDLETTRVIPGTVLEFDATTDTSEKNGYTVRVANASADWAAIAGVAQTNIATGDQGRILVRGKGKVRVPANNISSRDFLYASGTAGSLGVVASASNASPSAFALQSATTASTIDAFIVVL